MYCAGIVGWFGLWLVGWGNMGCGWWWFVVGCVGVAGDVWGWVFVCLVCWVWVWWVVLCLSFCRLVLGLCAGLCLVVWVVWGLVFLCVSNFVVVWLGWFVLLFGFGFWVCVLLFDALMFGFGFSVLICCGFWVLPFWVVWWGVVALGGLGCVCLGVLLLLVGLGWWLIVGLFGGLWFCELVGLLFGWFG